MSTTMHFKSDKSKRSSETAVVAVRINIERMKQALAGSSISAPQGMSREEKRRFIIAAGGGN